MLCPCPAPVVARVLTRSVVRTPTAPGPRHHGDVVMPQWRHGPHDPDADRPTGTTGAMLDGMPAALGDCPVELSVLAGPRHGVPALPSPPAGRPDDAGVASLHRAWDHRQHAGCTSLQPLHRNVHPGTLLLTAHGPAWTEPDEACRGPAGDLAGLSLRAPGELAARSRA